MRRQKLTREIKLMFEPGRLKNVCLAKTYELLVPKIKDSFRSNDENQPIAKVQLFSKTQAEECSK